MTDRAPPRPRPVLVALSLLALAALALPGRVLAHAGGVRGAGAGDLAVPTWLFLATGGGVIGASFLLASFVTDRAYVRRLDAWGDLLGDSGRTATLAGRLLGLAGLAFVLVAGAFGPDVGNRNAAVLLVWVAWWGAYVATAYLLGNTWPAVNPFRTVALALPSLDREYPDSWGRWPAVVGLLALVFLEVVTPLADDPRLLTLVVVGYGLLSLAGSVAFGADDWFGNADPVSRLLAAYGRVAPIHRTGRGLRLRLPGMGLTDAGWLRARSDVAFVVAVLFVTTFDGFVGTAAWAEVARTLFLAGLHPLLVYAVGMVVGYALFLAAYAVAVRAARRYGETFVSATALGRRFAPSLLAIAAGYHLAHNLGSVLALAPTLAVVLAAPLSPPPSPPQLLVPGWIGGVGIAAVLGGHLLAVWVAHATAYDLFPDRLQAIRSQYGVTAAMVVYTMVSLWILTRPGGAPPLV
ncbi:hypothetical protein [Halorarum salinum]|uniref:Uncharacterized protein n=1 Tax=Halorarum salinum TaxID=2743089 RepID=A0A7D5LA18_9EURY|nr:hypothetical protein [Halobaculum salinum]QLG61652.1 hypothetical protein HUG12_07900 [Halobaculum salinum]